MRLHVKNLHKNPQNTHLFPELLLGHLKNSNRKRGGVGGIHKYLLLDFLLLQKAFTKFYDPSPFHFGPEALARSENILKHFSCKKGYFHGALLLQDGELMAFSQKPLVERFPMPFSKLKSSE